MFSGFPRAASRVLALACLISGAATAASTISVTPATLASAFAAAKPGDTLKLSGTFATAGEIRLANRSFSSAVTIDATHATFVNTLQISNDTNLKIVGGTFNITGAVNYTQAIRVNGGSKIWIDHATVIGSAGTLGIVFNGTSVAQVSNGTFRGLQNAAVFGSVTNGLATRNTITGAFSDGIDIANSFGVTADYNRCSAGTPSPGAHPDCVQLWSVSGQPLEANIVVRNNIASGATQGFTAFASMGGTLRIQITNNTVNGSYPQGIACYGCIDSNISFNTVSTLPGSQYQTSVNVVGGTNNTVLGNVIGTYARSAASARALAFTDGPTIDAGVTPDLFTLLAGPGGENAGAVVLSRGGAGAVPEPSSWVLLLAGFAAIGVARRRGRSRTAGQAVHA